MLPRDRCNEIRLKMDHLVREEETRQNQIHIIKRLANFMAFERFLSLSNVLESAATLR